MTKRSVALGSTWAELGLTQEDLQRAREAVRPLCERLDLPGRLESCRPSHWGRHRPNGLPVLHLDDVSAIPFLVNIAGVEEYQHRARLRTGDGDLFAAVTPRTPGYEDYCRERLGMGDPEFLLPEPVGGPMEVARACSHGPIFSRLVERAKGAGGLALHPYMGIEAVWELAARLRQEAQVPVPVLGPPAPVTWIANDKSLFSEVVSRVVGEEWVVETRRHRAAEDLARSLLDLGRRHQRVGLKRTRCASGMGNAHWDLAADGITDTAAAGELVRRFLEETQWEGDEDVLVVAWEDASSSPSTQMWIPPLEAGPPRLDGVYEQILEHAEGVFLGSRPSGLPDAVNRAFGRASALVCAAFQALGYVGRCSFDALILGEPEGDFRCMFTECNGRWGGTSTPMSFVERLLPGRPRPAYRAQDFVHSDLAGADFPDLLARLGDALFDARTGQGQFVFYNVGPLSKGKLDVISMGRVQEEAEENVLERLPRLLGLS